MRIVVASREPPLMMVSLPQRLGAEALGTAALVFAGTGAIVVASVRPGSLTAEGISATFGLVVMVMIYVFGHISGAHFNPAVTLAFAAARHFRTTEVVPYWLAQILGACLASLCLYAMFGNVANLGATLPSGTDMQSFVLEIILTFLLMLVITSVATDSRAQGQAAAIAIGATVGLTSLFAGPISGDSMNPARSLGPALVSGNLHSIWIYLIAPPIGAVLGAFVYDFLRGETS